MSEERIINTPLIGVYMHRDGPITIDGNASVPDLLKVIEGLIAEMNWLKDEVRSRGRLIERY